MPGIMTTPPPDPRYTAPTPSQTLKYKIFGALPIDPARAGSRSRPGSREGIDVVQGEGITQEDVAADGGEARQGAETPRRGL